MAATATALIAPSQHQLTGRLSPAVIQTALLALHERRQMLTLQLAADSAEHGRFSYAAQADRADLQKVADAVRELEAFGS